MLNRIIDAAAKVHIKTVWLDTIYSFFWCELWFFQNYMRSIVSDKWHNSYH